MYQIFDFNHCFTKFFIPLHSQKRHNGAKSCRRANHCQRCLALGLRAEVFWEALPIEMANSSNQVVSNRESNSKLGKRTHSRVAKCIHIVSHIEAAQCADSNTIHADGEHSASYTMCNGAPSSQRKRIDCNVWRNWSTELLVLLNMANRTLLLLNNLLASVLQGSAYPKL